MRICSRTRFYGVASLFGSLASDGILWMHASTRKLALQPRFFSSAPPFHCKTPVAYPLSSGVVANISQLKIAKRVSFVTKPLFIRGNEYISLKCAMNVFMPELPKIILDRIPIETVIESEIYACLKVCQIQSPAKFLDLLAEKLPLALMQRKGIYIFNERYLYTRTIS